MKRYLLFVSCFFVVFLSNAQNSNYSPHFGIKKKAELPEVFINGTIHVNENTIIENGILIVKGNRIVEMGKNISIPKGAIIHDLTGQFIYPSFIELYSDLNISKEKSKEKLKNPQYKTSKKGPYHWNEAVRPEYNAIDNVKLVYNEIETFLKKGYGMVLSHQKNGIVRGTGSLHLLGKSSNSKILLDKAANFYSFNKGNSNQAYPTSLMGSIALLRQFFIDSKWYEKNNLNNHPKINLSYEAHVSNKKYPNIFVLDRKLDLMRASKVSEESGIDFIYKGSGKEYENIEQIKSISPKLIIPLDFPKPMDLENPYDAISVSTSDLSHWKYASLNIATLEKENISFCITSENLKSKVFFKNIQESLLSGAKKEKILYALTELPAKWLGIDSICGTINKGKLANFLITDKELFTKDFKILENWVLGKQEFKSITNSKDLRGNYKLITGNNEKKLLISGSINKPKAELKFRILKDSLLNGRPVISPSGDFVKIKSEKTVKVNFSLYENNVTISYSEGDNLIRLNGKIENDGQKWNGEGRDKYGEWFNWKAEKSNVQIITKTDTASKKIIKKKFIKNKQLDFCPSEQAELSNVLFENATIWTADHLETFKGKLWIRDGKIIDVGENIDLGNYNNVKVIDLEGKHITPGIIDEHSHIAIQSGVNEGSNAVTSEVRIGDVINPEDINIYRQLAGGVTSGQLLHGSANPIGGQSAIIKMRWGQTAEEMKIKTAPKFIKFALGENVKQSNWGWRYSIRYPQTRMGVEQIYYDAFIEAKEYQNKIDDFNNLPKKVKVKKIEPKKDLQLEALSEIINEKRFITCHSYIQSEINMLMKMADSMGFKINTFTHILEGYKVADKMKAHGVGASTFSDWWAYKYEVRDAIPHNACLLSQMGIVTAINSDDAEMGRRLNQEASKAIKYGGCSENEAIKLVTINPAKLLHIDDRTGSIKKGKDADIVIWDHSPLSVYAKVEQTYVDGRLLYDYIIQEKLFEENQKNRSNIISEMILAKKNGAQTQRIKKQDNKLHKCNEFEIDE